MKNKKFGSGSTFLGFILLTTVCLFSSCNKDKLKVDVSDIDVKINLQRFDQDLFSIDTANIWDETDDLKNKYGHFWDLYTYQILNIGGPNDKQFALKMKNFLSDAVISESHKMTNEVFNNSDFLINELTNSFKHYRYYFPDKKIPVIFTYLGGFNQSVVTDAGFIGIGLDKYLGSDCDFYYQLGIPSFARKQLTKENIACDCMRAWAIMEYPYNDTTDNLLNNMIYQGRLLYFAKAMMPEKNDTSIIRYSQKQLNYCVALEQEMYGFLIENKLLFSNEYKDIMRFTKDGPFTAGFKNSPARVGNWMGWQIVKNFMENNPRYTLKDLMNITDYQKIFIGSKYNP